MLSACATGSPLAVRAAPDWCTDYERVYTPAAHRADYPEVARAIDRNNAAWLCLCEDDCPDE
jgi:hypothetical protein